MKYLILASLLVLLGCKNDTDQGVKSQFVRFDIKNESDKEVTIFLYRRNNELFKEQLLKSGETAILDEGYESAPYSPTYSLTVSLDSAFILFEDNKTLVQTIRNQTQNDSINNILNRLFYVKFNGNLRFTLRQSDYLRAN